MALPPTKPLQIRPYVRGQDDKLVRFTIGRACVDSLATANNKLYLHPLTLSAWFGFSCLLITYMQWWPAADWPLWTWLKPVPLFAAWAVPIMFAIDWYNRPYFEARAEDVLRRPDMYQVEPYYARSPASGVWILEYGEKFVGLICVDASMDSLSEETLNDANKDDRKYLQNKWEKGTSHTANIRHFYAMTEYRKTGVQEDLLEYAIKHVFETDKTVKTIVATENTLDDWTTRAYRKEGFGVDRVVGKMGILGWELRRRVLTRKQWEERQKKAE
ncbi:hypothetical protein BDY19DRAFT_913875 [Irpex rosettiformis]|uniref:Uncharacterized protein n=1 Tax=Irpex rosettiformis TaxID=378272 RepID=A0ACB8UJZ9_9APHY|nr:hypothetical protein BDY19DRAFT_913875 [Irpex rosettiformis]